MNCFRHEGSVAVGVCKTCGRAVGKCCAREEESGITCSETCASEAAAIWTMNKKALRLYGIGEARRASRLNPAIMFWVLPGLAFVGFASVSSALAGRIDSTDAFALVLGGVLLLAGFWADRRQRKFDADLPSQSRQGQ